MLTQLDALARAILPYVLCMIDGRSFIAVQALPSPAARARRLPQVSPTQPLLSPQHLRPHRAALHCFACITPATIFAPFSNAGHNASSRSFAP